MGTKPVRKESAIAKKVRLLENKVRRLEKTLKEITAEIKRRDIEEIQELDRLSQPNNNHQ